MKFKIEPHAIDWWYWAITLVCMITGLYGSYAGSDSAAQLGLYGFYGVIAISWVQVVHFFAFKGPTAFPSQVRFAYALMVTLALIDPSYVLYWMLLVGTFMVTFFDRCIIARVLVHMPWNKGVHLTP